MKCLTFAKDILALENHLNRMVCYWGLILCRTFCAEGLGSLIDGWCSNSGDTGKDGSSTVNAENRRLNRPFYMGKARISLPKAATTFKYL